MKLRLMLAALCAMLATTGSVAVVAAPVQASAPTTTAQATKAATQKAEDKGFRPRAGGTFNHPTGRPAVQFRIEKVIREAIKHAKPDSYIKIALFSFDRRNVATLLNKAKRRGVHVQVVLNGHQFTRAMGMMRNVLGTNRNKKSFLHVCNAGCRGGGFLHTKMYLFSHSGKAHDTTMLGSTNLTGNAAIHQWNDLFVRNDDKRLHEVGNKVFDEMAKDKRAKPPYQIFEIRKKFEFQALPHPGNTKKNDPILKILEKVRCKNAEGGTGTNGRTKIRVSQHRWAGDRGVWIARRLIQLYGNGCDVRLLHGSADSKVRAAMRTRTKRGLVPLRSDGFDENGDGELDRYSHHKYMTISGHYGKDREAKILMTGSSNWAPIGVKGDDIIFLAHGGKYVRTWNRNWNYIWKNGSRPVTYRRVGFQRGDATGEPRATGKYWEND